MFLKALEIQGFKSFPDRTRITVGKGITAVVGPNGSGKSNISDAIRWVLGETSAKQLRGGGKMENVIFGGTQQRGAMGFASVSLVVDNTDRRIDVDNDEVTIGRKYYRSGDSEYSVNGQNVRLKDIYELFLDTGLGRDGYSVIGQGRIAEIVGAKSNERREIFEEASGIAKYRYRKNEAERRLASAEENLVRLRDILGELEERVGPLERESKKAKQYLELAERRKGLEVTLWVDTVQKARDTVREQQRKIEIAGADYARAGREIEAIDAETESTRAEIEHLITEADRCNAEIRAITEEIAGADSRIAVLENDIAHNDATIASLKEEIGQSGLGREAIAAEVRGHGEGIAACERQAAAYAARTGELEALLEELQNRSAASGERRGVVTGRLNAMAARITDLKVAAAGAASSVEAAKKRLAAAESEGAANAALTRDLEEQKAETDAFLQDAVERLTRLENIKGGLTLKVESRRGALAQADENEQKLLRAIEAARQRIAMLKDLERNMDGFQSSVKAVMKAAANRRLRGVTGPVSTILSVKPGYEVAIETALGFALQNIVVDRDTDAKEAISFLKRRDAGRATFLPMSAIRGDMLREPRLDQEYGFVGIASQLVTYDARYDGIFQNLLGRTVVVEDLDCGVNMARRYQNRFRIVTLDGQVINRGGSMTGGSVSRSAGVLSRASELSGLREQLTGLKASLDQAAHRAEETGRDLQKAQYELDVAREQQQNAAQQVLALETRGQHYDSLRETLNATLEALDAENLRLTRQTADGDARRRELQTEIDGQEDLARQLRQQAQDCLAGQSDLQSKTGGISDRITRCKEQQAALAAERQGAESRLADLRQLMTDLDGDCRSREDLARQLHESQVRAREQMAEHQTRCDSLHRQAEDLRGQLQTLQQEKLDLEQQRTALNRQTQTCNDAVIAAQQELSRLEQKRSAAAMEEKTILDKLWERYELSHSEAQAQRVELESIPKATRRIGELNRSIKALGTPNIGAIEEYERVNGRYTYLSDQRADVEQAKGELTGVIDQLTQQMTEIFAQQFRLLNDSFQETFLELFGGGKARLELEDEKDILNCGIEIKVQPPGKQLKTITLLSGGEKAFVAIALYFAILKVHPTPFCVMDEIEAALDEANVVRYARYMRRIAGKTQFIVITHRRGTMEEADVLYGVTMQERGVSRILTINLNDMAKELNIK